MLSRDNIAVREEHFNKTKRERRSREQEKWSYRRTMNQEAEDHRRINGKCFKII